MNTLRSLLALSLCIAAATALSIAVVSAQENAGQTSETETGFLSIFDGKSVDGWKSNESPNSWHIENGAIVAHGQRSHLFYIGEAQPFKNFHLKIDVKTTPGSNSGIYFHTKWQDEGWPQFGYECQVNISQSDPKKTAGLYGVKDVFEAPAKDNEWYTQEIIVQGHQVVTKVNGKTIVEYTEPEEKDPSSGNLGRRLSEGTIALQAHDPDSKVFFKNIQIKKLD